MGFLPLGLSVPFIRGCPSRGASRLCRGRPHQRRGHTAREHTPKTRTPGQHKTAAQLPRKAQREGQPRPTHEGEHTKPQFGTVPAHVPHRRHGTANGGGRRGQSNRRALAEWAGIKLIAGRVRKRANALHSSTICFILRAFAPPEKPKKYLSIVAVTLWLRALSPLRVRPSTV